MTFAAGESILFCGGITVWANKAAPLSWHFYDQLSAESEIRSLATLHVFGCRL